MTINLDEIPDWCVDVQFGGGTTRVDIYQWMARISRLQETKTPTTVPLWEWYDAVRGIMSEMGLPKMSDHQVNQFVIKMNEADETLSKKYATRSDTTDSPDGSLASFASTLGENLDMN